MIDYIDIYEVNRTQRRLKRGSYSFFQYDKHTQESDQLYLFTFGPRAKEQSQANLDRCLEVARGLDITTVVLTENRIQLATDQGTGRVALAARSLFPKDWMEEHKRWLEATNHPGATTESTDQGEYMDFWSYRRGLCLHEHQGVYDVASGKRLTNRRAIIERYWAMGFATQRGRPPTIARVRWTGSREELDLLTDLANRHWDRRYASEAAKKMVSAFRSINRYAAWPGAW